MMKKLCVEEQGWNIFAVLNINHTNKEFERVYHIFLNWEFNPDLWSLCVEKSFPIILNQYIRHLFT